MFWFFGKNLQEHDKNLELVLQKIKEYGMNENLQKRIERVTEVKFSGYLIGNNKIKPSLDRTAAITKFTLPKTKKEPQRFLGLLNYDRMFL
jgi:queuine/archaeosine tRNA-ribosyltransferase